jgi:hypothetical protein
MPLPLALFSRRRAQVWGVLASACLLLGPATRGAAQPRGDGQAWLEQRYERFGPYGFVHSQEARVFHADGQLLPTNQGAWNYWFDLSPLGQEFRLRASDIPTTAGRLDLQLGDHAPTDPRQDPLWWEFQPQVWVRGATAELQHGRLTFGLRSGALTQQRNFFGWGRSPVVTRTIGGSVLARPRASDLWLATLDAQSALPDGQPGRAVGQLYWGRTPTVGWSWMGQTRLSREEVTGNWGGSFLARGGYRNSRREVMVLVRRISPAFRTLGLYVNPHVNEWGTRLEARHRLDPSGAVGVSLDLAQDLKRRRSGYPIERRLTFRMFASAPISKPFALHADIGFRDRSTPDPDSLLIDQTAILGGVKLGFRTPGTQVEISSRRTIYRDPTSEVGDWYESWVGATVQHSLDRRLRAETKLWLAERRRPNGLWLSHERSAELRLNWDASTRQAGWIAVGRELQEADETAFARDQWDVSLGWAQSLPWDLMLELDTFHYIAASDLRADRSRWSFRLGRTFRFGGGPLGYEEGLPEFGRIDGRVFEDRNANGHQDPGEVGIPDLPLQLGSGERILTGRDGSYHFPEAATPRESVTLNVARLPSRYLTPPEPRFSATLRPRQEIVHDYPIRLAAGVAGRVVVFDGSQAVGAPDVLVVVEGTHHDVFTDQQGRFEIPGLEAGRITLKVVEWSLPEKTRAYDPLRKAVTLRAGETVPAGVFVLEPVEVTILQYYQPGAGAEGR